MVVVVTAPKDYVYRIHLKLGLAQSKMKIIHLNPKSQQQKQLQQQYKRQQQQQ